MFKFWGDINSQSPKSQPWSVTSQWVSHTFLDLQNRQGVSKKRYRNTNKIKKVPLFLETPCTVSAVSTVSTVLTVLLAHLRVDFRAFFILHILKKNLYFRAQKIWRECLHRSKLASKIPLNKSNSIAFINVLCKYPLTADKCIQSLKNVNFWYFSQFLLRGLQNSIN